MNTSTLCARLLRPLLSRKNVARNALVTTLIPSSSLAASVPLQRIPTAQVQRRQKQSLSRTQMPSRPKPPRDDELEESFLKGSGPGGQKINKTNSAVQLKHIATGIVIKCQKTRSRSQNRLIARQLLAAKLDDLYNGESSRQAIVGGVKKKKSDSAAKKSRRKYKKLAEEKGKLSEEEEEDGEEQEEEDDGNTEEIPDPRPEVLETRAKEPVKTKQHVEDVGQTTKTVG